MKHYLRTQCTLLFSEGGFKLLETFAALSVLLATPLHAQFTYVANVSITSVSGYSIGSGGTLTTIPGSPFSTGGPSSHPDAIAVDPTGRFAYSANAGASSVSMVGSSVSAYTIGSNGTLTLLPG